MDPTWLPARLDIQRCVIGLLVVMERDHGLHGQLRTGMPRTLIAQTVSQEAKLTYSYRLHGQLRINMPHSLSSQTIRQEAKVIYNIAQQQSSLSTLTDDVSHYLQTEQHLGWLVPFAVG